MIPRFTPDTVLETEKYNFRFVAPTDAPAFYKLIDDDIVSFMPFSVPENVIDSEKAIEGMLQKSAEGLSSSFVIVEKITKKVLGLISIARYYDEVNAIEFGYWIGKEYWGKGIITDVVRFFTDYAFSKMKVHKVIICAQKENIGSRRVAEKLGAKFDGILRDEKIRKGKFVDIAHYSLFEDEFIR